MNRSPLIRRVAALALPVLAASVIGLVGPASATSGTSSYGFTNGATLTSNIWLQTWANSSGCSDYSTSVVISGGWNPAAGNDWVRNRTSFQAWGLGASLDAFGQSAKEVSQEWTNNNGSRGTYMSGQMCENWLTAGVSGKTAGTAYYNGQTVSTIASL